MLDFMQKKVYDYNVIRADSPI